MEKIRKLKQIKNYKPSRKKKVHKNEVNFNGYYRESE